MDVNSQMSGGGLIIPLTFPHPASTRMLHLSKTQHSPPCPNSEGQKVLDVGCGVGGPARNIARFSGADITGITINDYQVGAAHLRLCWSC